MLFARRILFGAWSGYALLWLAALTSTLWTPRNADLGWAMIVILGFGLGLILALLALLLGIVLGWRALRVSANRTWPNLLLVAVSIAGLAAQALYASVFFFGAL